MEKLFKQLLEEKLIEESTDGCVTFAEIASGASDQGWFVRPEARQRIEVFLSINDDSKEDSK